MSKKHKASLSTSLVPLNNFLHTALMHHKIISFLLAMMTLIYCVYSIQATFSLPSDDNYRTESLKNNTKTSFDKATIELIKKLRTSADQTPIRLPDGRINPFKE